MSLKIIRELDLRKLKSNIEKLEKEQKVEVLNEKYTGCQYINDFYKSIEREDYLEDLELDIKLPDLIISANPSDDWKNSKILFSAMQKLPVIYARDERLWTYLTHTIYWDYMKKRWYKPNSDIISRYFFKGNATVDTISVSSIPYTRNGIGRLWWGAYVVYNKMLADPLEFLPELFATQDLFVGICERSISKNKDLITAVLKMVRKYQLSKMINHTELIRNILKEVNFQAAITMFEVLEPYEIDNMVERIVKQKMRELYLI